MSQQSYIPRHTDMYLMRAVTHLHPGSGEADYGIVDKRVQRDPITKLPVIHASGIKGAFRELFSYQIDPEKPKGQDDHPLILSIFGGSIDTARNRQTDQQNYAGSHQFFDARILSLPVRSDYFPYFQVTSPNVIDTFLRLAKQTRAKLSDSIIKGLEDLKKLEHPLALVSESGQIPDTIFLEDYRVSTQSMSEDIKALVPILGQHIGMVSNDVFSTLCGQLPVIARNHLENGISQNLWYEEVVPRETRFFFMLRHPNQVAPDSLLDELIRLRNGIQKADCQKTFDQILGQLDILPPYHVQVGANASIGYGLCELTLLTQ